jgi:hypothetical protein
MPNRKQWQVWREEEGHDDIVLFKGGKAAAYSFYKKHGGSGAGLHIGYDCGGIDEA